MLIWWLVGYLFSMLTAWALNGKVQVSDWVWSVMFALLGPIMWWVFLDCTKEYD